MTQIRTWTGSSWRVLSGGTPDVRVPTSPRDLTITATSGALDLVWQAPYDNGGAPISGYRVTVNPGNLIQNVSGSTLNTTVSGLSNGTVYTISVAASNSSGMSLATTTQASPSGPWVLGGTGSLVGAPAGWGGNGGTNNQRGAYAATAPPAGVTNGAQIGATQCGVKPVLDSKGQDYGDLTFVTTPGTFIDATGQASGTISYDSGTGLASITVTREGAILEYLDIPGQIFVRANNVIVRYCRIDARNVATTGSYVIKTYTQYTGLRVEYCEIICGQFISAAIPPYGEYTARYCDVWNISNDAFKVGDNTLVEFNWIHGLNKAPGAHADAVQWTAGNNIYARFNHIDLQTGDASESYQLADFGNGATQVGKMTGNGAWFAFEDNYADGCTYTIRAGNGSPDAKGWTTEHAFWRRNRLGRRFMFGPLYNAVQASADQIVDDSNIWHSSGQTYVRDATTNKWYYAQVVTQGQSIKTWSSARNGEVS